MIQFTEDQIYQIGKMAAGGQTLREIAKRMGVSTMKIKCVMSENEIKTKKMGKRTPSKKVKAKEGDFFNWGNWGHEGIKLVLG